jgi:hypothetical protein
LLIVAGIRDQRKTLWSFPRFRTFTQDPKIWRRLAVLFPSLFNSSLSSCGSRSLSCDFDIFFRSQQNKVKILNIKIFSDIALSSLEFTG